jgi:kynureninase
MSYDLEAPQLDTMDPFKPLTHLFDIPVNVAGQTMLYLNGNSLGPKLKRINEAVFQQCETWGRLGVRGHFEGQNPWMHFHQRVTEQLTRLVGAQSDEVIAMGTLTGNLHLAFISFYQPTKTRYKIIRVAGFPSDTYALESQVRQRLETLRAFSAETPFTVAEAIIEIKPDEAGYISFNRIAETLAQHGQQTAVLWFEAVHYLTGQFFDIEAITQLAHQYGCKVGFDLAHAIGNLSLQLHDWRVDFAVWCHYKYISAGPGAIAGLYIHNQYVHDRNILRLAGWWGNKASTRFAMLPDFDPSLSAEAWQLSNAEMFSLAALHETLSLFDDVDLVALREKNKRLVAYLDYLLEKNLTENVEVITPKNPEERGCQLSLRVIAFQSMEQVEQLFLDKGIVCDVRDKLVRVAPMGLYNSYQDVFYFVQQLRQIIAEIFSLENRMTP